MTTLHHMRLFCDGMGCKETLVIQKPGSARQLKLAAARHGWLVQRGEFCPTHRLIVEDTGSIVAQ